MRKKIIASLQTLTVSFTLLYAIAANAQDDKKYQELAVRLVQSASLKPGEAVIIQGGKHMIPLMEAVAIEVQKAGGFPNMFLSSDRVSRSFYTEVPEKYLEQEQRYFAEWLKHTDVYIGLPSTEDNKALIAGIPEERFAKASKGGEFFNNILNSLPVRVVSIDFPTQQDAVNNGMDFPSYQKMITGAINADYNMISAKGGQLKQMLQNAKQIRITSAAGTDFTFSPVAGREIMLDDGIVTAEEAKSPLFIQRLASLPAGAINFAPLETSANGKVIIPKDECRYEPMNDISFEFKAGVMQNFKAGTNATCFQESMKPYTGDKERFGSINIGLNPALLVEEKGTAHYRPGSAAGMVWIGVGDNRFLGGNNSNIGGFGFPVTNATVTIDGKIVIKDGKLLL